MGTIPNTLVSISAIEAIENFATKSLQESFCRYYNAVENNKKFPNGGHEETLKQLDLMVQKDIKHLTGETTLPLEDFSYFQKLEIVAAAHEANARSFLELDI